MAITDDVFPPSTPPPLIYRGRRWIAALFLAMAPMCFAVAALTTTLDDAWLAVLLMGLPLAVGGYLCMAFGWAEAVARVELGEAGLSLTLPRYRGFIPAWPAQKLTASWPEVRALRRQTVRGGIFVFDFDYIRRRIVADQGEAALIEPIQSKWTGDARGLRQSIPVGEIIAEIERRSGLASIDDGEVRGGGLVRNLLVGGPG